MAGAVQQDPERAGHIHQDGEHIATKERGRQLRAGAHVRTAFIALMLCAGFLRLYRLDHYPLPMHQDELSEAYDAWSLVETGADRAGQRLPFVLRATGPGDYRPALYAWLATVPVSFTGFSVSASRLPSAVLGIASLVLLFSFASSLIDRRFGIVALAFAVFSPWHITYSRLAHEGAMLPPFFVILTLWLWMRAAEREYPLGHMALIGFSFGLSASAYQSSRLIGPLMVIMIACDLWRFAPSRFRAAAALAVASLLGAAPQLYVMVTAPDQFFGRFSGTAGTAARGPSALEALASNVGFVFSPKVLFWPDMISTGYVAVRSLPIELPFFYLGLLTLHRLQPSAIGRFRWYVYITFLIGIIPALISGNTFSIRISAILLLMPLWTAAGIVWVARRFSRLGLGAAAFYLGLGAVTAASIGFVSYMYFGSERANGQQSNNALVQVGERLKTLNLPYNRVFVVDSPWYSGLHVAAFSGMKPDEYQRTVKVTVDANNWDYVTSVGKYRFLKPRELPAAARVACSSSDPELFVSRERIDAIPPMDSVAWVTEKYYFTELSLRSGC